MALTISFLPVQLPELEEKIRTNSAKCAQVEHECAELERDIMQLKTKLTTSYRSRILATFPGGNLAQVLSYSQSMSTELHKHRTLLRACTVSMRFVE